MADEWGKLSNPGIEAGDSISKEDTFGLGVSNESNFDDFGTLDTKFLCITIPNCFSGCSISCSCSAGGGSAYIEPEEEIQL